MTWTLRTSAAVERAIADLPEKVAPAIIELLTGPLVASPHRVGRPLKDELARYHVAKRGPYRVIYRIDETTQTVFVTRVAHRSEAYRRL